MLREYKLFQRKAIDNYIEALRYYATQMKKSSRPPMFIDGKKRCSKCKQYKPLEEFHKNKSKVGGLSWWCKQCKNKKEKLIRAKYTDKKLAQRSKAANEYYHKQRKLAIDILGGKCIRCGFSDIRALQIDHIHGDGYADRKKKSHWRHQHKFITERPEEAKKKYQVLCANHNRIKAIENKEYYKKI